MLERGIFLGEKGVKTGSAQDVWSKVLRTTLETAKKAGYREAPLPVETIAEITRFTPEARAKLEKKGYVIHALTGKSIVNLRDARKPFWSTWHQGKTFEQIPSRLTEVAINPRQLFLKDSNNKTLDQQIEMIAQFSEKLTKDRGKIDGVQAIMGDVSDYVELAFTHLEATSNNGEAVYLFGPNYNYQYARTITPTEGVDVAHVGHFIPGHGLDVYRWTRDQGLDDVWAVPLVVPQS